jgi:hypothetical protein
MNRKDDPMADALARAPVPDLDPAVADRVLALARAHLEPAAATLPLAARFRLTLAGATVPALLASAVVDKVVETAGIVDQVYGPARKPPPR